MPDDDPMDVEMIDLRNDTATFRCGLTLPIRRYLDYEGYDCCADEACVAIAHSHELGYFELAVYHDQPVTVH